MADFERAAAGVVTATWDLYRDLRDAAVENAFFRTYAAVPATMTGRQDVDDLAHRDDDTSRTTAALARMAKRDRTAGIVRAALLLMKAGTGRRRLSAMKKARELVGRDVGLVDMPAEKAQAIIREQSYLVELDPERALATLPEVLGTAEDRRIMLGVLDKLEGRLEANESQMSLLKDIRRRLDQPISETIEISRLAAKRPVAPDRLRETQRSRGH